MKKLLSLLLCFILVFSFAACSNNNQYKQVIFEHADYFSKGISFIIPEEWYYTELESDSLFVLKNIGTKYGIAEKITDNEFSELCKNKSAQKINDNTIIESDSENTTIFANNGTEILKISFSTTDIEQKTIKQIAKSISFYDIETEKTITNNVKSTVPESTDTIDLSFLETPESADIKYPIETIYGTYNSLDTVAQLFSKEWIGQRIGFLTMSNVAYFSLNCDDGYHYRFVENYTTNQFELWRSEYSDISDKTEFDTIYKKPLAANCNIVTTNHQFIINQADYLIITLDEAKQIISTADFSRSNAIKEISSYTLNAKSFETEYYISEIMAYFHIYEDYNSRKASYSIYGINGISDHIDSEYSALNTFKDLSATADINNYKKFGLHFE